MLYTTFDGARPELECSGHYPIIYVPIKQNTNFVNKIETEKPRNIKVSPFCFELTYQIHVLKYPQSTAGGQN